MQNEIVGFCHRGAGAGLYVIVTMIEGPTRSLDRYDLMFSGAIESEDIFPGDVMSVDPHDEENRSFLESLSIQEVPSPWNRRVRESLFESVHTSESSAEIWGGTGRLAGAESLAKRVRMIEAQLSERARVFATVSRMNTEAMVDEVVSQAELLTSLSLFLSASGLSLSIVKNTHSPGDALEPWREYGG